MFYAHYNLKLLCYNLFIVILQEFYRDFPLGNLSVTDYSTAMHICQYA